MSQRMALHCKTLNILSYFVEESCTGTFQIGGVMVSVLGLSAVDHGQTKDYKISICRFSAKYAALSRKSKDWLD